MKDFESMGVEEIARHAGVPTTIIAQRMEAGMTKKEAATTQINGRLPPNRLLIASGLRPAFCVSMASKFSKIRISNMPWRQL